MYVRMYVRTYGRTDKGDAICPPSIINGGGIKTRLYADDTSLGYSSSELAQIKIVLNNDLKESKNGHLNC